MDSLDLPYSLTIAGYDPVATAGDDYYFDPEAAESPVEFFAARLRHVKGQRSPLILTPFQQTIIRNLFGWKHKKTHLRRYRNCFLFLSRKNGKSTLAAAISIWFLVCDGEAGAEVLLAATDKEQAGLVFDVVAGMIAQQPKLSAKCKVLESRKRVLHPASGSYLQAIPADHSGAHGFNASFCCCDEVAQYPDRQLWDVLKTSQGSRRQPLFLGITTAGLLDKESLCWEEYDYACKVRDNVIQDHTYLPVIYQASHDDDWTSPETHKKANPNYGISISAEYLTAQCKLAQTLPSYQNSFKQLHLNIFTEAESKFILRDVWDKNYQAIDLTKLDGQVCYGGLDLADTKDLAAFVLAFPIEDRIILRSFFWMPSEGFAKRINTDKVPYDKWLRMPEANLTKTDGPRIRYEAIERTILDCCEQYRVKAIAFDRYNSNSIVTNLEDKSINMVKWSQGFEAMNQPTKDFEVLLVNERINHLNNPILSWCADNVTVVTRGDGMIRPTKPDGNYPHKVDGIVAAIMSVGLLNTMSKKVRTPQVISW